MIGRTSDPPVTNLSENRMGGASLVDHGMPLDNGGMKRMIGADYAC